MFEYRRRRRQVLRQLKLAEKEFKAEALKLKDVMPEEVNLFGLNVSRYQTRKHDLEMELEVLEAKHLLDTAKWWGVEGSAPQDTYDPNYSGLEPRTYFKPQYKEAMRKMIADARRKRIIEWVSIISPLATVIISLLALAISALALYLQFYGQSR